MRSVGTGNITSGDYPSLVVCTYSGKVVSLSADPASADATGSRAAAYIRGVFDEMHLYGCFKAEQRGFPDSTSIDEGKDNSQ